MKIYSLEASGFVAATGTGLTYLFGAWDTALLVLVAFMVLDYGTGLLRAYVNKEISSEKGFKGLIRKGVILIVLIVAVLLDRLLNTGTWVFRTLVCFFYIANEGISLLENCAGLGLKLPPQLLEALLQLEEGNKKEIRKGDEK
ncbi:phage holin family protein [Clostridium cylindrosporum]|nr:phage holin family protein [Clostridium cylindrosporum]